VAATIDPPDAETLLETLPHGVFTVDADGVITAFNRAAEELTGWRREEVLGRCCREIFPGRRCVSDCVLLPGSEEESPLRRDRRERIVRRDGREIPVAVSTAPLRDARGQVVGGLQVLRDLSATDTVRRRAQSDGTCGDLISRSTSMREVCELLPLVARSKSTVLIEGEPGTGKELVARSIHNLGPRAEGPFVVVNCGALPETLVESELFGHVRGAFTGARGDKPGRFALAAGGTLLLDEIGDVSPAMQVKLLRVLQEKEFLPLGATEPVRADVRILAATHRDLRQEVVRGNFRQDLYFRLNVVRIVLPPLSERWQDIPLLVHHFIQRFNVTQGRRIGGISESAMSALIDYDYPGNVRELENAIEHAFVVCAGDTLRLEDLPPNVRSGKRRTTAPGADPPPLEVAEAEAIREALRHHRGNRTHAAAALGISRNTLWRKMRRHGIR
jgi:PAS domain S-box-containing protein